MLQAPCLLLPGVAAAFVEAVAPRIGYALVKIRKLSGLREHGSAVVGDATPDPPPGLIGVINPYCCEFPTHEGPIPCNEPRRPLHETGAQLT